MEGEGMEGRVKALYVFRERGQPGKRVEKALFLANQGMEGDRHATGGAKQVTLLDREICSWMREQPQPGLCFGRYKANIETEGLATGGLSAGHLLRAGEALLQVSEAEKRCFPECPLFRQGRECRLSRGALCLLVKETGQIAENDRIVRENPGDPQC